MKYIRTIHDEVEGHEAGGKARALARLSREGFPVPQWFVVIPAAYSADKSDVEQEIEQALQQMGSGPFAVRSSGVDEDSAGHSFAGQFESYLFVSRTAVAEAARKVWASGFSDRVQAYRRERGLGNTADAAPAVLVQQMVDADAAGVAFSVDPLTGRQRVAVISAVWGLGTQLVGGDADADTWRVQDRQILSREIATKRTAHRAGDGHEITADVPLDQQQLPALNDSLIVEVAELARRCADYFGRPQDIEWAVRDGKLFLLQSRPITTLAGKADPDGELAVFDNSNIAESYGGITTPLTFTFARRAYTGVYREFCKLMSVPHAVIERNELIFGQMLALIRGRVYYNLLSWYRLLAMLPGFAANRGFMEGMMGVREPLPEELTQKVLQQAGTASGWQARWGMVKSIVGLLRNHLSLNRQIQDFYNRLNEALAPPAVPLERMRYEELTAEFRRLESLLLKRWDAPLVNDFLAMIYFGVLGKLCTKWLGQDHVTLHSDLIREGGGIISAEPAQRIARMGQLAATHPDAVRALCDGSPWQATQQMHKVSGLHQQYQEYLAKFGDRCLEELKLESSTLQDDPTSLLRAIGHAARRGVRENTTGEGRRDAEAKTKDSLRGKPIKSLLFSFVLKQARHRVRDRENLRFERTRLFGRCRKIFIECGKRLSAVDQLDDPRDVFYLEVDEILGLADATTSTIDVRGLVSVRKREFDRYRNERPPSDRFETRAAVHLGNTFESRQPPTPIDGSAALKGLGCCAGIVRGPARVIRDPRGAQLRPGEILVAERTDPGWIMLFPAAAGILVERGSLLSHSAIVAREMGIPAVVSIPDLLQKLTDGQLVEMDGSAGTIRILDAAEGK